MWKKEKEELEAIIEQKVHEKLREAVSEVTTEWEKKKLHLMHEVELLEDKLNDLKSEVEKMELIREKSIQFNVPVEVILAEVDYFKEVLLETENETRNQIQESLGRTYIPETTNYESEELEAGVKYRVSKDSYVGIVGFNFLGGSGSFEPILDQFRCRKFMVVEGDRYKLFKRGVVVPSECTFFLRPLTPESKLKYTLIGVGFNNPKMEKVT